ncbi:unnamed protein product [Closterium sp. Yama58-4]|nr:unnamed protein product [Closterium sp. Yama58-4]
MAFPRVLTCLLIIAGVLLSSSLPGAEAVSEAAKQRAAKAGLTFVKAVLTMLFPPPTPAAKFYSADFSDLNVAGTFSIAVPSKAATKPSQFRLTAAGSPYPPEEVTLNARTPVVLGSLGKNLQCSQVAPSVWDCFGQTKLTQADINNIGFTAGSGVRVNSYALSLTYRDASNMGLMVDSNANLAVAKANSKMEQVFGKTDLLAGVAAGRFQTAINGDQLKGGAMFAVSNINRKCKLDVSIVVVSPDAPKPSATLSVTDPASADTTDFSLPCAWTQPRPGVWLCEWLDNFPSVSGAAAGTADAAYAAAASMRAAALPGSAVESVFKLTVESDAGDAAQGTLRYAL